PTADDLNTIKAAIEKANPDVVAAKGEVTVSPDGKTATITYPDGSVDTVNVALKQNTAAATEDKDIPADNAVGVYNPEAPTADDLNTIKAAIEKANPDVVAAKGEVTVSPDGKTATITYPDGSKDEVTVALKQNTAAKTDPVDLLDEAAEPDVDTRVVVKNSESLTEVERTAVADAIKAANPNNDDVKNATITVDEKGVATITYADGSVDTINADQLVKDQITKATDPVNPVVTGVADVNALSETEQKAVKDAIAKANEDIADKIKSIEVDAKGVVTVTYTDDSTDTITADKTVKAVPLPKVSEAASNGDVTFDYSNADYQTGDQVVTKFIQPGVGEITAILTKQADGTWVNSTPEIALPAGYENGSFTLKANQIADGTKAFIHTISADGAVSPDADITATDYDSGDVYNYWGSKDVAATDANERGTVLELHFPLADGLPWADGNSENKHSEGGDIITVKYTDVNDAVHEVVFKKQTQALNDTAANNVWEAQGELPEGVSIVYDLGPGQFVEETAVGLNVSNLKAESTVYATRTDAYGNVTGETSQTSYTLPIIPVTVTANVNGTVDVGLPENPTTGTLVEIAVPYPTTDGSEIVKVSYVYNGSAWVVAPNHPQYDPTNAANAEKVQATVNGSTITLSADSVANGKDVVATIYDNQSGVRAGEASDTALANLADTTTPVSVQTPVGNTSQLTADEQTKVAKALKDANKDNADITDITVAADGTATVTYSDGSSETISSDKTVKPEIAPQVEPVTTSTETYYVGDTTALTETEQANLANWIKTGLNKDIPQVQDATVTVDATGKVTITYTDGSVDTFSASSLLAALEKPSVFEAVSSSGDVFIAFEPNVEDSSVQSAAQKAGTYYKAGDTIAVTATLVPQVKGTAVSEYSAEAVATALAQQPKVVTFTFTYDGSSWKQTNDAGVVDSNKTYSNGMYFASGQVLDGTTVSVVAGRANPDGTTGHSSAETEIANTYVSGVKVGTSPYTTANLGNDAGTTTPLWLQLQAGGNGHRSKVDTTDAEGQPMYTGTEGGDTTVIKTVRYDGTESTYTFVRGAQAPNGVTQSQYASDLTNEALSAEGWRRTGGSNQSESESPTIFFGGENTDVGGALNGSYLQISVTDAAGYTADAYPDAAYYVQNGRIYGDHDGTVTAGVDDTLTITSQDFLRANSPDAHAVQLNGVEISLTKALQIAETDTAHISLGNGIDTLEIKMDEFSGSFADLSSKSTSIEHIHFAGNDNHFEIELSDLLDMNQRVGSTEKILVVDQTAGSTGNEISISVADAIPNGTQTVDSITYNVYSYSDSTYQLWVQDGISVSSI
ncbi:hypothetical protein, partial [Lonepinella sp. BR2357]|uniref:hypothetical protein n=1 Tax=Lonepinella sp. BR2357 TaxID=3434549 RepID=UPI003F6E2E14